jgi:hypothetical protein
LFANERVGRQVFEGLQASPKGIGTDEVGEVVSELFVVFAVAAFARVDPVAASVKVFAGARVMRNAAGFLTKGATATRCMNVGRAAFNEDNSGGAARAATLEYQAGIFGSANLAADLVTQADVGKLCTIVDDQTAAKTSGTATRSAAGYVDGIEGGTVGFLFPQVLQASQPKPMMISEINCSITSTAPLHHRSRLN